MADNEYRTYGTALCCLVLTLLGAGVTIHSWDYSESGIRWIFILMTGLFFTLTILFSEVGGKKVKLVAEVSLAIFLLAFIVTLAILWNTGPPRK